MSILALDDILEQKSKFSKSTIGK